MKQKSPEIEIPEGSFYNGIDGYHIYVKEKDPKTKALKNIMIYDFSDGFNNSVVMVADSARLKTASNKQSLILDLYSGESFENLKKKAESKQKNVPYRRETFSFKEILIDFDANFNKADESIMKNRYLGKDLAELTKNMDSMQYHADSMCHSQYNMYYGHFFDRAQTNVYTIYSKTTEDLPSFTSERLLSRRTIPEQTKAVERAIQQTDRMKMDLPFIQGVKNGDDARIRRFDIERHRKFTIPLSCIIFFFIAAPLGAIIRKGGIGLPLVVSVIFFIIYYIIDNTGYKMAREGVWYVWQGIWLSSIVLFPLGILLTYMAAKDRSFNLKQPQFYWKKLKNFFSSKFGQKESYRERRGIYKERG
jgi:lipopolysaccharide export system permease protein